jgi:hypothetical protein
MASMERLLKLFGVALIMLLVISAYYAEAATFDQSTSIVCAFTQAVECDSQKTCERTTLEDVGLPPFFKLDLKEKVITGMGVSEGADQKKTKVISFQRADEKMFLQGIEVRGWSMVISENTGKMTLAVSGDDEAFVLFGACVPF